MINSIDKILSNYKSEILVIEKSSLSEFKNVEMGITISRKYIKQLRVLLREMKFENDEDEINFFKHQKPYIYSRVKFYAKLYQFLLHRPQGSVARQRKFIDEEIDKLQLDYTKNLDFVKYIREESTYLDKYYFLRGKDEVKLITDTSYYLTDDEFSTSHDNMVAKISAYDLLINHYQHLLSELHFRRKKIRALNNSLKNRREKSLRWTATKTDLIELIYSLQISGAIEEGRLSIKQLAEACEELFEMQFDNVYRTYLEIKGRKNDRTKFLDKLKTCLILKIEKDEE
ncbi:RteC domain-containing protein [Winogradskyella ursingii]|uniref:RteC domain-containing protein n=1 Tax=Winogradskyella ursingii TaxID=2686079 RepID=UPI0015CA9035|nr:RteC domain-containing protein [Winogradskyella ursingii]